MQNKREAAHCLLIQEAIRTGWVGVEEFLVKCKDWQPSMASLTREELIKSSVDFFGDRLVTDQRILATVILKYSDLGQDWPATENYIRPVFGHELAARLVRKTQDMVLRKFTEQQRFVPRASRGERRGYR